MHMLESLIAELDALGAPAELGSLRAMLRARPFTRAELAPFVSFDDGHYARNEVARSAWYELVCVCWKPGQRTPIHDHRASSCAFLVVEGAATEIRYDIDDAGLLAGAHEPAVRERGYICASWDADIHEVVNHTARDLITLHIYSPALSQVHIYCRETGAGELWTPHLECAPSPGD